MSERDAPLALEPDERVLWQGPARIGAVWPPLAELMKETARVLAFGAAITAPVVLAALIELANGRGAALVSLAWLGAFALAGAVGLLLVIEASRRLGPYHASFVLIVLLAPPAAFVWASRVVARGWSGAVASVGPIEVVIAALVALPLARIAAGVAARSATTYVITDRRVLALRRSRVVWQRAASDLRVEAWWSSPAGRLVVGEGRDGRELHVRGAPGAVLEDVLARRGRPAP